MKQIWKFNVPTFGTIDIPKGAELLSVHAQNDAVCLWALVDPTAVPVRRLFVTYGTGHPIADENGKYIGTVHLEGGALVLHVFEIPLRKQDQAVTPG